MLLPPLLPAPNPPPQLSKSREFTLVGKANPVPLRIVEISGILVGAMGEEIESHGPRLVQFDFYVNVPDHVAPHGRSPVACGFIAVPYGAVHDDPVIEELGGDGYIEDVVAGGILLIIQSHVYRNIELLEDIVQLVRHDFGHGGIKHGGVVGDPRLLVRHEAVGNQEGKELSLDLVLGGEG